jgi:hypothetical protein
MVSDHNILPLFSVETWNVLHQRHIGVYWTATAIHQVQTLKIKDAAWTNSSLTTITAS